MKMSIGLYSIAKKPKFISNASICLYVSFFIIIIAFLFIPTPDIIICDAVINTRKQPILLSNLQSGIIQKIFVTNKASVKKGQPLLLFQSEVDYNLVHKVKDYLSLDLITEFDDAIDAFDISLLGHLSESFIEYKKNLINYHTFKKHNNFFNNIESAEIQIEIYYTENRNIENDLKFQLINQEYLSTKLKNDSILYNQEFIVKEEIDKSYLSVMQINSQIEAKRNKLENNRLKILDLNNKIKTYTNDYNYKKEELVQNIKSSLGLLKANIQKWENNYIIYSTAIGTIEYLNPITEGQLIPASTNLFVQINERDDYICHIKIPEKGAGKVKIDQLVNIKIEAYPFQQYGVIEGKVKTINLSYDLENQTYLSEIAINKALLSTNEHCFNFSNTLKGKAEIILEERFFYKKLISKVLEIKQ